MKLEIKTNEFSNVIKEIRKAERYTIKDFAEKCKFPNPQYLSNVETRVKPATFKTLQKVCKACNYEISIIIKTKK